MKTIPAVLGLLLFASIMGTGCTKETIVKEITRDTTITIIRSPTTQELILGKFNTTHHEIEAYSNGILSSKKLEYFTGFYFELKNDGNYNVKNQDGVSTGIWELSSPNYLLMDKNTANERYFYILYIDTKSFLLRGPFKKNGDLKLNYLTNTYYER